MKQAVIFDVKVELVNLGFKGVFLEDLLMLVKTADDFEAFQNFIILNDHRLPTQFMIVHKYMEKIVASRETMTKQAFVDSVINAQTIESKVGVMTELFLHKVEPTNMLYHRMLEFSHNDGFLSDVYDAYEKEPLSHPLSYVKEIAYEYRTNGL